MKGLLVVNGFLNNERFNVLYEMLEEAFRKKNIILEKITNNQLLVNIDNDKKNPDIDFILFWDKDVLLAKHLENLGYKVYNSASAIAICDDKGLTALMLEKNGIRIPKTILCPFTYDNNGFNNFGFVDKIIEELTLPLILKENKGSFGNEVYLIKTKEELIDKLIKLSGKRLLFQEFIKESFGIDIRVLVCDNVAIGAVKRVGLPDEFRSNVLKGGHMERIESIPEFLELSEKISKLLKLDFGSIDFMVDKDFHPIFCEANSNVHFRTFYSVTGINLADYIVDKIIKNKD